MILGIVPSVRRLWFEGMVQRKEAVGGVKWNLSTCEHQEEDAGKERKILEIIIWKKMGADAFCLSGEASH